MYIQGDSIVLVEAGDTLYANYGDGDWRINANGTGLQGIPGGSTANGGNSLAGGLVNRANGFTSLSFGGSNNIVDGIASSNIGGTVNSVTGFYSSNLGGENNVVSGDNATTIGGESNTAFSYGETVLGLFSTTYAPTSETVYSSTDKLLVVGNGTGTGARSNALTLLKDGRLGLGVDGNAAQTATLHVKPAVAASDPLRVEDLNIAQANDTALLVVNPADGTVRYLDLDSVGTIDSLSHLRTDTLSVHQGNSVSKVLLANTMAEIYDVVGGDSLEDAFAVLPFGTDGIVDANYTTTGGDNITVTNAGRYRISYRVTIEMTGGNNRSTSEFQLTNNGAAVAGTFAGAYHRNDLSNTTTSTVVKVVDLAAGDVIRVEGRRSTGAGHLKTKANGSSLLIERL